MTEQQFQEARKIMQTANTYRGYITVHKNNVAKWTALEAKAKEDMQPEREKAAKENTLKAINRLNDWRKKFADLKFPV